MFNTANEKLQNLNVNVSLPLTQAQKSAGDSVKQGQELDEMFEYERLSGEVESTDPLKYSDKAAKGQSGSDTFPKGNPPEGYVWVGEWKVDTTLPYVDKDGTAPK